MQPSSKRWLVIAAVGIGLGVVVVSGLVLYWFPDAAKTFYEEKRPGSMSEVVCKARGGVMVPAGCSLAGECFDECALPYPDGGKPCTTSSQCKGLCLVDQQYERSDVYVTSGFDVSPSCQKYDRLPNCSGAGEVLPDGSTRQAGECSIS